MNISQPLVSIIIPVFGVETYICECLKSVKDQTYDRFECLIVDDCGEDKSILYAQKLIREWNDDNRFRIIRRKNNGGLSAARNTGLDYAKGEYVYFLDGDDKIMPKAIAQLITKAIKYEDVEIVQGNVIYENHNEVWHFTHGDFPEFSKDREWIRQQMLQWKVAISSWNKLYKREYLINNNLRFVEGILHEDVQWCWDNQKVIRSIAFCDYNSYWYRTSNQTSIMHHTDKTRSAISFLMIYNALRGEISDKMELEFVKKYILPYKVSLHRWAFSTNRSLIRKILWDASHREAPVALVVRCIFLNILLYIFPFNLYRALNK